MAAPKIIYEQSFRVKEISVRNISPEKYQVLKMIIANECSKLDKDITLEFD